MRDNGEFTLSVSLAAQMVNLFNWLGSFCYMIPEKIGASQRNTIIFGQAAILVSSILVIIFIELEENILMLVMIALFFLFS